MRGRWKAWEDDMGESNDSSKKTKTTYPELERRKSREPSYGEASERARHEKARRPGDNTAFYLIEREAIELRRLRWQSSKEPKAVSTRVDDIASERKGKWAQRIAARGALPPEQRLAQYAPPSNERTSRERDCSPPPKTRCRAASTRSNMINGVVGRKPRTKPKGRGQDKGAGA